MAYKFCKSSVEKNKETYKQNLVKFQDSHKSRQFSVLETSFKEYSKVPLKSDIVSRFKYLSIDVKAKKQRIDIISEEVISLWKEQLNFPCLTEQSVKRKINDVIEKYESLRKKGNADLLQREIFDITNHNGIWLSSEDKKLYEIQLQSKGKIGYATSKLAGKKTIHPSILQKLSSQPSTSKSYSSFSESSKIKRDGSSSEFEENDEEFQIDNQSTDEEYNNLEKRPRKYSSCKIATKLVVSTKVSTNKACNIGKILSSEGLHVPTPSQSGIYKALFREAKKFKETLIQDLKNDNWSIHFDGKHIEQWEYQVVVLKNESREIKLGALKLIDGKSITIFNAIADIIDEFKLWNSIKMIVTDTTNVNTGKKNGVVVQLQDMFQKKGLQKPQFVPCQHHILDRILRLEMEEKLGENSSSPNINYFFTKELLEHYETLKQIFCNGTEEIKETGGWRDDMKFLFHLTRTYRYYDQNKLFPNVRFQKIPNISNARWSSRAILALLAYILMPKTRNKLESVCSFISYKWADFWFDDQTYKENTYSDLHKVLLNKKKPLATFTNHWNPEPSAINIPRSNQCAERAIKVMEDLYGLCRNKDSLPLRFILSNKQ